jgi:hypothetical protein
VLLYMMRTVNARQKMPIAGSIGLMRFILLLYPTWKCWL